MWRSKSLLIFAYCLLPVACLSASCRQDMHDNPRYEANEEGANRQLPEGTVARGSLELNPAAPKSGASQAPAAKPLAVAASATLAAAAAPVAGAQMTPASSPVTAAGGANQAVPAGEDGFPFKVTKEILDRGQSRYNISCSPCHSRIGDGNGMIVQRGFRRPPSYHEERLRKAPTSYFYDVITNGFGAMYAYSDQLTPEDRWKVIAYIRVLQLSQGASAAELAEVDKQKLAEAEKKPKGKNGSHSTAQPATQTPGQPAAGGHGN